MNSGGQGSGSSRKLQKLFSSMPRGRSKETILTVEAVAQTNSTSNGNVFSKIFKIGKTKKRDKKEPSKPTKARRYSFQFQKLAANDSYLEDETLCEGLLQIKSGDKSEFKLYMFEMKGHNLLFRKTKDSQLYILDLATVKLITLNEKDKLITLDILEAPELTWLKSIENDDNQPSLREWFDVLQTECQKSDLIPLNVEN